METDAVTFQDHTNSYLWFNFWFTLVSSSPILILMKEKPEFPPSNSELNKESPPIKESLKLLMKNKSFIYLLINTGGVIGHTNLYAIIINEVFNKYNITAQQTSIISFVSSPIGMVFAFLIGHFLDKTKSYKKVYVILTLLTLIFHTTLFLSLEMFPGNEYIICLVFWTIICSFTIPVFALSFDYACELTYPAGIKEILNLR